MLSVAMSVPRANSTFGTTESCKYCSNLSANRPANLTRMAFCDQCAHTSDRSADQSYALGAPRPGAGSDNAVAAGKPRLRSGPVQGRFAGQMHRRRKFQSECIGGAREGTSGELHRTRSPQTQMTFGQLRGWRRMTTLATDAQLNSPPARSPHGAFISCLA